MRKWFLKKRSADYGDIIDQLNISPLLATIMANRGITTVKDAEMYLSNSLELLGDPFQMKDMEKAVSYINNNKNTNIRIVGDYDIDGVTATYILLKGLEKIGIHADYQIPDRIEDGYGINVAIIEKAHQDNIDLIITCDNGIAALDAIKRAKELGIMVIITDHHNLPVIDGKSVLPDTDIIINPKQEDCNYPYKNICGAVVAWKLICALHKQANVLDIKEYLEFAAIGTIGDVMDLQQENRLIVKLGLRKLARTTNAGLRDLARICDIDLNEVSSYHIGFIIGPCINATGRLDTAKRAVELFLSGKEDSYNIAKELKALNDERKEITEEFKEIAFQQVEDLYMNDKVLVVYLPDCHESIAGIIAGKVRERYYKPAFVLTKAKDGIKGSGRSIDGYNMHKALIDQDKYLGKYGGHTLAAGLSIPNEETLTQFRKAINSACTLTDEDLIEKVYIDVTLPIEHVSEELIHSLSVLEPFGNANKKPIFACRDITLTNAKVLGKNKNVLKGTLTNNSGDSIDGILFDNNASKAKETLEDEVASILYYPSINEFRGKTTLQAIITDYTL
ncbi:single-stranded-DNA-specific exonuclease [Lachnospiraceae bacterium PF1-22]